MTGALFLKSNVHLVIGKDVTLLGSQLLQDYPEIDTRVAGIEMRWPAALINIIDARNASVSGEGVIDARGKFNWDLYWNMLKKYDSLGLRWIVDYDVKRVRTILVQNADHILIQGIKLKNAGFWTVQLLYSKYVTVKGITIRNNEDGSGPSTDGIDVDSSSWILIEDCDIDCNDDNFCLKARHTDNGLRIKSATTRGGTIVDIYFENSELDSINNVFQFNLNWYPAYSYSHCHRVIPMIAFRLIGKRCSGK